MAAAPARSTQTIPFSPEAVEEEDEEAAGAAEAVLVADFEANTLEDEAVEVAELPPKTASIIPARALRETHMVTDLTNA